jgi:uncharacterized ion transporter superfamily protein YfcC
MMTSTLGFAGFGSSAKAAAHGIATAAALIMPSDFAMLRLVMWFAFMVFFASWVWFEIVHVRTPRKRSGFLWFEEKGTRIARIGTKKTLPASTFAIRS